MKWVCGFILGMAISSTAGVANANNDELLVIACQAYKSNGEQAGLVSILEQIEPDDGHLLDNVTHPQGTDKVDAVMRFYRGDLWSSTIEEIAANEELLDTAYGKASRIHQRLLLFRAIDNGFPANFHFEYDDPSASRYLRTDGKRMLSLRCQFPTSVSEAFPNR